MSPWSWRRLLGAVLMVTLPSIAGGAPFPGPPSAVEALRSASMVAGDWSAPADGPLVRPFDPPARPWSPGHRGADWAAPDARVRAPAAGTVHFAGPVAGRPAITLSHGGGLFSSLEPVAAASGLEVGDRVVSGRVIGTVAGPSTGTVVDPDASGHCPQQCVHWGLRLRDGWVVDGTAWDRYLDPLVVLGWSGPSVLWPLEGGPPDPG